MAEQKIKCEVCGSAAVAEVVPDGFDETPKSFTVTVECSGPCRKTYRSLTPQEMHEMTGLPQSGWPR